MQYQILITEGGEEADTYPLANRSPRVFRELRELQIASTDYTDEERYRFAREMKMEEEWVESRSEDGETVRLKDPEFAIDTFRIKAAALLFPLAPVADNEDEVDLEVARQAIEDFTGRIGRKKGGLTGLFD